MTSTALVRRPGPRLTEGLVTHVQRQPVDLDRAREQWEGYVAALRGCGWDVVEVPPADDCPDAVFVEDTAVVRGGAAVLARPGAASRRPEVAATGAVLRELGYAPAGISAPATLDGGDVLQTGDVAYVGVGGRTTLAAAEQLGAALDVRVVPVPQTRVLHLKSAVTALPDGTIIGWPPHVGDAGAFSLSLRFRGVPEEAGSHVVRLGGRRVLLASSAARTAELLAADGYEPVVVDVGEFEKLEGCVTCLSIRLRELPRSPSPPES